MRSIIKNKAFTLAEVLITLLIIGVVSSMVIPAIISDAQNQEYKVAWKKTYAIFAQASQRLAMDNGGNIKGLYNTNDAFRNAYLPYLQYTKTCNQSTSTGLNGCWHALNSWFFLSGDPYSWAGDRSWTSRVILNDGTLVVVGGDQNCNNYDSITGACIEIMVDINGYKKPNTVGKDIFVLIVYENGKVLPMGTSRTNFAGDCIPSQGSGLGCASEYLK